MKQPQLIDREALQTWLWQQYHHERYSVARARGYQDVLRQIQSGRFNVEEDKKIDTQIIDQTKSLNEQNRRNKGTGENISLPQRN